MSVRGSRELNYIGNSGAQGHGYFVKLAARASCNYTEHHEYHSSIESSWIMLQIAVCPAAIIVETDRMECSREPYTAMVEKCNTKRVCDVTELTPCQASKRHRRSATDKVSKDGH